MTAGGDASALGWDEEASTSERDDPGGADPWNRVAGQPAAVSTAQAALAREEVAHAWLLVGPRGVGQTALTRALGAALNCPVSDDPARGCGACDTCQRIARGRHPAVLDLVPAGANHLVDDVRSDWIPTATRSLTDGRRRVLRIEAADRMNEAAQNAFLKVLEEPPAGVVWLLDVEDDQALLETVVSRCRRLDLVPWTPAIMREQARDLGIDEDRVEHVARAALGSPTRLSLLAETDVAAARQRHLDVVDRLATAGPGVVVPLAKELVAWAKQRSSATKEANKAELAALEEAFGVDDRGRGWPTGLKTQVTRRFERAERQAQREGLWFLLDDLASYLRDLLVVHAGGDRDQLINVDAEAAIRRDVQRLTMRDVHVAAVAVSTCRQAIERNGAPELQLERLLLQLALPIYAKAA